MNNYITQQVHLPVLFLTMIALTFISCKDMTNSSQDSELEALTSEQNGSYLNVVIGNIPDGLLPNSQQYNNSSKPVATGKSGGVTLNARAMMNSQMVVDLEVTSGELDTNEDATGTFSRVQVKALDTGNSGSNKPAWVKNYNKLDDGGSFTESYDNLLYGQQLDIQANVREMFEDKRNSARTGVISLLETVKFRPDLAVTNIDAPANAAVLEPITIIAEVSENLGDLGSTADCILRMNGDEIDRSAGIWVDAGDAVLCSFQTHFGTTGTKSGEVSVENVTPGDFDYSNNSSIFQIEVTDSGLNEFNWTAYAFIDVDDYTYSFSNWNYGDNTSDNETGKRQSLWVNSYTSNPVGYPMNIDVNVISGSHSWLNEALTSINADSYNDHYATSITYLPNNSYIEVLQYKDNYLYNNNTNVLFYKYARNVVYYGYDYYGDYYYYEYKDTIHPFDNSVTFKITLDGSEGAATMTGEIPLSEGTYSQENCYDSGCSSYNMRYLDGHAFGYQD